MSGHDDYQPEEKLTLLPKKNEATTPSASHDDHKLGLLRSMVDYELHIPFHVPRIPHTEGAAFWDNWLHHAPSPDDPEGAPREPAPTPPLAVRVFVLVLLFLLVFGPSLSYASVGAIYTQLKTDMGFTDSELGFLFSAYALPNIVAVFFAGIMVDSLGVNLCLVLFASLYMVGNLLALGQSYMFLLGGRILYGLGTECVSVVQDALLARWYSHDTKVTLSVALAVCMLSFRLSSFISMFGVPEVYEQWGFFMVLLITAAVVAVSYASALTLVVVDKRYDQYLKPTSPEEGFSWGGILRLPLLFWALVVTTFGVYGAVLPFISFSSEYLQQKWALSDVDASRVSSSLYLAATLVMVPFGFLIDRYGHRVTLTFTACVLPLVAYSLLLFTDITPFVGCALLGVTHGLLPAAVFPSIALIVEPKVLGTAYGILTSALNAALFVSPFLLGLVPDMLGEADGAVLMFTGVTKVSQVRIELLSGFALLGLLGAVVAWYLDAHTGHVLERTCVLKLGTKVSDRLLRQSQQLFEDEDMQMAEKR